MSFINAFLLNLLLAMPLSTLAADHCPNENEVSVTSTHPLEIAAPCDWKIYFKSPSKTSAVNVKFIAVNSGPVYEKTPTTVVYINSCSYHVGDAYLELIPRASHPATTVAILRNNKWSTGGYNVGYTCSGPLASSCKWSE